MKKTNDTQTVTKRNREPRATGEKCEKGVGNPLFACSHPPAGDKIAKNRNFAGFCNSLTSVILSVLFVVYLVVLAKITLFRGVYFGAQNVNFIPFATIIEYLQSIISGNKLIGIANLFGNVILFFPLGYIAPTLFRPLRTWVRIPALSLALSVVIEAAQFILACGATDVDDVILNVLGGAAGYWAYALSAARPPRKRRAVLISTVAIAVACMGLPATGLVRVPIDIRPPAEVFYETPVEWQDNGEDDAAWYLILVNRWNAIPDDYEVELTALANGQSVDERIYPALQEMFDAARDDGVYPVVVSGHRTAETQQRLMDEKIAAYRAEGCSAEEAVAKAEAWVATPGTSEHQLGIAVDINADGIHSTGNEVYEWLNQNSHQFGFICRYPADKTEITGVISEPWHYRYVGVDAATALYRQGLCLEEYLTD